MLIYREVFLNIAFHRFLSQRLARAGLGLYQGRNTAMSVFKNAHGHIDFPLFFSWRCTPVHSMPLFPSLFRGQDSADSHRRAKLTSASPIYTIQVKISENVLSPVRKNAQFTIFEDKVNILFPHEADASFDLYNLTIRLIPDLDSMLVLGCHDANANDVYIFTKTSRQRQKCIDLMCLLEFKVKDEHDSLMLRRRMTTSSSMPNLPALNTIWEV